MFYFPINIGNLIIPIDFHIFQRVQTTNQLSVLFIVVNIFEKKATLDYLKIVAHWMIRENDDHIADILVFKCCFKLIWCNDVNLHLVGGYLYIPIHSKRV